jgi:twitching motility protein PilJ
VVGVVDELTAAGRKISVDADSAAEAARHALDFAEKGNRAVRDTADGMQRIRASLQATTEKIKSLGDRSLEIYEIINLIHETNLLALNAVLEATRSGNGQSLEILAAEQRKLADHSRAATRDIVTLLKSIQAESNDAAVVMEQANRTAEAGERLTDQASNAFSGISNLLRQTADLAMTISSSSGQQAKDLGDVKTELATQAQGAHRNAGRAHEALSQAEQVTRLCEQLNLALAQFRSGPTIIKPEPKPESTPEVMPEINSATAAAGD